MTAAPGAVGLLWLWATTAGLGPGEPEHPAQVPGAAETPETRDVKSLTGRLTTRPYQPARAVWLAPEPVASSVPPLRWEWG